MKVVNFFDISHDQYVHTHTAFFRLGRGRTFFLKVREMRINFASVQTETLCNVTVLMKRCSTHIIIAIDYNSKKAERFINDFRAKRGEYKNTPTHTSSSTQKNIYKSKRSTKIYISLYLFSFFV